MKGALFIVLVLLSIGERAGQATRNDEQRGTVTVRLTGFADDKGTTMVALTNAQGFLKNAGAVRAESVSLRDRSAVCIFNNVPYGGYAIQAYHDENGNKKLDSNVFGIPTERYGFSNDALGSFGPPRYEEAEFKLASVAITIDILVR
jgi:uncharacterized protein (DUF2141 family)